MGGAVGIGLLQVIKDMGLKEPYSGQTILVSSEIAEYFGYNEKYITTFFKKASGVSLKTYILNQKMDMAKALLSDTNKPISQIGYEIGFSDNHNFSSAFKKITGQSPSDYRNTYAQRKLFHE